MITRIEVWGEGFAVPIPRSLAENAGVGDGSRVEVRLEDGRLVIAPLATPHYDLGELLEQITPENLHGEVDFGLPVGGEVCVVPLQAMSEVIRSKCACRPNCRLQELFLPTR